MTPSTRSYWRATSHMIAARHEKLLSEVRIRFGEAESQRMIEFAKKKGETTVLSFWDWLQWASEKLSKGEDYEEKKTDQTNGEARPTP